MKAALLIAAAVWLTLPLRAQSLPDIASFDAVAIDNAGYLYVAGTIPGDLPTTAGVFQSSLSPACGGCVNGYIAKLTSSGAIVWASYLGATVLPAFTAIAVAPNQNVYIARSSTANSGLPIFSGYQAAATDMFVMEVAADGKTIVAGTYFGAAGDSVRALRIDSAGNVYLAGTAQSAAFPTTPGAYQTKPVVGRPQDLCSGPGDEFVAKFDGGLKRLVFSTLIGTGEHEIARDLALGSDGSVYVLGQRGFAHLFGCFATTLTRLAADGSAAIYSAAVSDSGFEGNYLAVDASGFAYASGDNGQFSPPFRGSVIRFDPLGAIAARQAIAGRVELLALSGSELVVTGRTATGGFGTLTPTPDSGPMCIDTDPSGFGSVPYVARLDASSLQVRYAGYLPSWGVWPVAGDKMLVMRPYGSATRIAMLYPGAPAPGTITCVANGATFAGWSVAPGEVVSLFGNQVGPAIPLLAEYDAEGDVTTRLGGYQVLAEGTAAPLLYAGPGQINLVLPFGLVPGNASRLEVRKDGALVGGYDLQVAPFHPGLFNGALNQDGTRNSGDNPAAAGSTVALFATGLGAMTPAAVDGSRPLEIANHPVANWSALVNGRNAAIEYIGNAPGLVAGVVQINVRLPQGVVGTSTIFIQSNATDFSARSTVFAK
jgi:uncharacterized protein (TIGR03437 family)